MRGRARNLLVSGAVAITAIAAVSAAFIPSGGGAGTANLFVFPGTNGSTCDSTPTRSSTLVAWASAPLAAKACTVQQAWDASSAGDAVELRSGTYSTIGIDNGGTTTARSPRVTMAVEQGGTVNVTGVSWMAGINGLVLDGTNGAGGYGFQSNDTVDIGTHGVNPVSVSNFTIKGYWWHDGSGGGPGLFMLRCQNVIAQQTKITNWVQGDGIQIWSSSSQSPCDTVLVEDSIMTDFSCDGTQADHQDMMQILHGRNITTRRAWWDGLYCHTVSGSASGSQGWFVSCGGGVPAGTPACANITLEDSVIANMDPLDALGRGAVAVYIANGLTVRNNTIDGPVKTDVGGPNPQPPTNATFQNNLVTETNCSVIDTLLAQRGTGAYGNNVLTSDCGNGDAVNASPDSWFVNRVDPRSIGATPGDYHLAPGGFPIGKANQTTFTATDIDSQTRPQGGSVDAGADER